MKELSAMQQMKVALHLRHMRAKASAQSERRPQRMARMQRICNLWARGAHAGTVRISLCDQFKQRQVKHANHRRQAVNKDGLEL